MTYIYGARKKKPGTIIRSCIQPVHIYYPLVLQGEEEFSRSTSVTEIMLNIKPKFEEHKLPTFLGTQEE
jgi:hypothetical protein